MCFSLDGPHIKNVPPILSKQSDAPHTYHGLAYLERCQTPMMYLFRTLSNTYDGALYEYSDRFLVVNHSHKKPPSQMFSKVLNMHPVETQFPLFFLLPKAQYTWSKIRRASVSFILGRVPGLNFFHLFLKIENLLKFSESVKNI